MPNEITGFLTQKIGPFPGWVWLVVAGGGVYVISKTGVLSGITGGGTSTTPTAAQQAAASASQAQAAAATATGQTAGSQLSQSIGLLQQLQGFDQELYQSNLQQIQESQSAANALQTPSGPSPVAQTITVTSLPPNLTTAVLSQPVAGQLGDNTFVKYIIGIVPTGTQLPSAGPVVSGPVFCSNVTQSTSSFNAGNPLCSGQWQPVDYHGTTGYIWGPNVGVAAAQGGASPGIGGPAPARHPIGQMPSMWRPGHPMLKRGNPTYAHYGVGGPGHVTQVAARMGVHPARVLALNEHAKAGTRPPGTYFRVA